MDSEQRKILFRIILSSLILIVINFVNVSGLSKLILFLIPYFIIGYDILLEAVEGIKEREIFDENFLMSIASIGALCLAFFYNGDYNEAVAVLILYQTGEFFSDYAADKSRKNILDLMDIRPDYANVEVEGKIKKLNPAEIAIGTEILIKPGEKIPLDGIIVEGNSSLDMKALTGESLPKSVNINDEVLSGSINLSGVLKVKTTRKFAESTASKILDLVENSQNRKSKSEKFITKFAKIYTPFVCVSALALAIVPTLFYGNLSTWLYRALVFLVVSCPCALVISVPLSFFSGIGGAGRKGILIKGSNFLEILANASSVIFDKTGTLTKGVFEVVAVHPELRDENEILHLAAHVEKFSSHPIADALRKAYESENDDCKVENVEEFAGYGVKALVNGERVCLGSEKFMDSLKISWKPCTKTKSGTIIHVAINESYAGHIIISDVVKNNSREAVQKLKSLGITRILMLTGDSETSAKDVADKLEINEYHFGLLPDDKARFVSDLNKCIFVGDGINDAPVLSRADAGIAMGALGSDAAIEAADIVLMDDDPLKVYEAIKISRKTMKIVKQNIYFSIGIKVLCLSLGALGFADLWLAVFADVGVMILAVLNAIRAMF